MALFSQLSMLMETQCCAYSDGFVCVRTCALMSHVRSSAGMLLSAHCRSDKQVRNAQLPLESLCVAPVQACA